MWENVKSIAKNLSSLGVGFKLALIVSSYIGAGSLAKWVVEIWYPFTRRMWDLAASAINFPELDNVTKDTLTALVFFLPFGISAILSRNKSAQDSLFERIFSAALAFAFVYILCKDLLFQIYLSFFPSLVREDQGFDWVEFGIGAVGPMIAMAGIYIIQFLVKRYMIGIIESFFSAIGRALRGFERYRLFLILKENILVILLSLQTVIILIAMAPSVYDIIVQAADLQLSASIYFALAGMLLVVASVVLSVLRVPKQVRIAAGAALGFLSAAYAYDAWVYATETIERIATEEATE